MNHPSMLSYIQSFLSRPYSPSPSVTGLKRKRSTVSTATRAQSTTSTSTTNTTTSSNPSAQERSETSTTSQEAAIASFLALPDGPLIKRARRGDDEDVSGGRNKGRLSIISEGVEDEGCLGRGQEQEQGGLMGLGIEKNTDGARYAEKSHENEKRDEDRDVEMEDVDLDEDGDREQGLWTYRGGNSMLR